MRKLFLFREDKWFFIGAVAVRVALLVVLMSAFGSSWSFKTPNASEQFLTIGQNVFAGKGFLNPDTGVYESAKAPGYALFLGFFSALHLPLWAASVIQIIIFSLLPIFAMRFMGKLGGGTGARRLAGALTAFEPLQILYSVSLMPDALTAVLVFFGVYFLFSFSRSTRIAHLFYSALFLALSNYFRPVGVYWFFLIPLVIAGWQGLMQKKWLSGVWRGLFFGAIFFLLLTPWTVRNYARFGTFAFSSSSVPYFFSFSAPAVEAAAGGKDFWEVQKELRDNVLSRLPEPRDINSIKNEAVLGPIAQTIIRSHPVAFLKLYIFSLQTYFTSENYHYLLKYYGVIGDPQSGQVSLTDLFAKQGIRAVLNRVGVFVREPYGMIALGGRIFGTVLLLASLWGAYVLWRRRDEYRFASVLYIFFLLYGALTVATAVAGIEARHRLYLNALIFMFAAIGFTSGLRREKMIGQRG